MRVAKGFPAPRKVNLKAPALKIDKKSSILGTGGRRGRAKQSFDFPYGPEHGAVRSSSFLLAKKAEGYRAAERDFCTKTWAEIKILVKLCNFL